MEETPRRNYTYQIVSATVLGNLLNKWLNQPRTIILRIIKATLWFLTFRILWWLSYKTKLMPIWLNHFGWLSMLPYFQWIWQSFNRLWFSVFRHRYLRLTLIPCIATYVYNTYKMSVPFLCFEVCLPCPSHLYLPVSGSCPTWYSKFHIGRHFFLAWAWRVSMWAWRVDSDRHYFDWMILTSNIRKIRGSLSGDNIRLALSQWIPPITWRWCVNMSCSLPIKSAIKKFAERGGPLGRFPVMAEITHCPTFRKERNHARACSQYFTNNFYCKIVLECFLL